MSKINNKIDQLPKPTEVWSATIGHAVEDFFEAIIAFIPNGLNALYDGFLKRIPLLGKIFSHAWIEAFLKLLLGITIGKGIARDVARYVFRPIGYAIGWFIGAFYIFPMKSQPTYQGAFGHTMKQLSGMVVSCALLSILVGVALNTQWGFGSIPLSLWVIYGFFAALGALVGCLIKLMILYAMHVVGKNYTQKQQSIYQQSRALCQTVRQLARRQSKGRVLTQAQDIIQQINGPQSQQHLEKFFEAKYDKIADHIHEKIDRHIQFLADRACHGDRLAFQKLKDLNFTGKSIQGKVSTLSALLDKVFNEQAIFKLKDAVDTAFDQWYYRECRS